ncbi:MAG TPA: cobalamin biosynthesis protein CbiG [Clostridiales bacterium]|nr:cobalamin biosynthesis protein CbiG [Clostridiales bacterium]
MNIDIYAFSRSGAALCDKIIEKVNIHNIEAFVPERYLDAAAHVKLRTDSLYISTEQSFKKKDCIIFIGATGIAVRAIAPFVKSKKTDPAVICMDEKGINVISLLSGHIGGANKLTLEIAEAVGGNPIITTATNINGKFAIDEWAHDHNLHITSLKRARDIAAHILENNKIGFYSDFNVCGSLPEEVDLNEKGIGFCVSLDSNISPFDNTLNLIPKIVSVGVGCRRGASFDAIYNAVKTVLSDCGISPLAIKSINSIELKKDEAGLIKAAEALEVPFNTYKEEKLNSIDGEFSHSEFVKFTAGVDTVCERAAVMGSKSMKLHIKKTVINSVTVAVAVDDYELDFEQ